MPISLDLIRDEPDILSILLVIALNFRFLPFQRAAENKSTVLSSACNRGLTPNKVYKRCRVYSMLHDGYMKHLCRPCGHRDDDETDQVYSGENAEFLPQGGA